MREVVTTEVDGEAVFVPVGALEPERSHGYSIWRLGGHDSLPVSLPAAGLPAEAGRMFPPAGGFRVYRTVIPPDSAPRQAGEIEGLDDLLEGDGFHRTDSLDIGWVIAGEVGLELSHGRVEWLGVGDLVVQNGTRHAWRNRSEEAAILGTVCFGAVRKEA